MQDERRRLKRKRLGKTDRQKEDAKIVGCLQALEAVLVVNKRS